MQGTEPPEEGIVAFHSDKVTLRGPDVDGGFTVTLKVGAFEKTKLKGIVDFPELTSIAVVLKPLPKGEDIHEDI